MAAALLALLVVACDASIVRRSAFEVASNGSIQKTTGTPAKLTMWGVGDVVKAGECEYAGFGIGSVAAQTPYIPNKYYCAVRDDLFKNGAGCGICYKISYGGAGGSNAGRAGELVVQAVDRNAVSDHADAKEFDCQVGAFQNITGARTGVFPVNYERVDCDVTPEGPVAMVITGGNKWFIKVIFSNMISAVESAKMTVGSKSYNMKRTSGATWEAQMDDGPTGKASFEVKLDNSKVVNFPDCFQSMPQPSKAACRASGAIAAKKQEQEPQAQENGAGAPGARPAPGQANGGSGNWLKPACTGDNITAPNVYCYNMGKEICGRSYFKYSESVDAKYRGKAYQCRWFAKGTGSGGPDESCPDPSGCCRNWGGECTPP
mmetsp:Transcript_74340/g.131455  ORF Transcript_74340/g.131455 Transcript_74340/m.131455 type:complete len:375 (+) Transcript_74340:85-1209(+)|eukprot:CAMPEP_0197641702 /NCGR_PEP_ID=MMETSP1338-20131121/15591_1 /TAXON_ID=43686 ORGANISM="Pelagodinium beii, Strain RCC1491" /NCGR_SAMPLE_ID=MMETSP1338 /ASSEMBLY_ACC=CAM_ASM_000754 /LENGTH=374 /DNA_ID=CAMNT_0043214731 /DNA_START=84 /DNA_END=1208 /DNA_ORIENTATION=-